MVCSVESSTTRWRKIIKPIRKRNLEATHDKIYEACNTKNSLMDNAMGAHETIVSSMHEDHHHLQPKMKKIKIAEEKPCLDENDLGESYTPILSSSSGKNIFDCYDLREELGSGGYASTHMCIEKATGQKYACKVIEKDKLISEEEEEDVRFEISMMAHLNLREHRNVIKLVGTYEDCRKVYIVMELCEGGELLDQMQQIRFYTEDQAAAILKDIIQAIKYCHERRVIHRDIKPENVLFLSKKNAAVLKLIDFGLSTYFKPGQKFTEVVGTTCYMAPEVMTGRHGKEVDVWSAGVILYTLLAGKYPFFGEDDEELREAIMNKKIDFDGESWEYISLEAKDLVKGMLNRDPDERLTVQQILEHPWFAKQEQ